MPLNAKASTNYAPHPTCVLQELGVIIKDCGVATSSNDLGHGVACSAEWGRAAGQRRQQQCGRLCM
jgi:hypothetical protein